MKRHAPGPPLLFTMIMKAMVMPRTTSSESRRCTPVLGAKAGLVMVGAVAVFVISAGRLPRDRVAHKLRAQAIVRQGPEFPSRRGVPGSMNYAIAAHSRRFENSGLICRLSPSGSD